jgi:hypothetical protein
MAFNAAFGATLLFGGQDTPNTVLGDTWEWDGSDWIPHGVLPGPIPSYATAMAYDSTRHQTILYGGRDAAGTNYAQFQAWDGTQWVFPGSSGSPGVRFSAGMTYDTDRNKLVLFGGKDGFHFFTYKNDTWEWDSATGVWTRVEAGGLPPSYTGPSGRATPLAYDAARHQVVLFGGEAYLLAWVGETWTRSIDILPGPPVIVSDPLDTTAAYQGNASFSVVIDGSGVIAYQWRHDGAPLADDPRISGSRSSTLTITGILLQDAGGYDVIVTNPCGSATSRTATLSVAHCPADFNFDGITNSQDYFDFLTAFFAGSPTADFDGSGTIDSADFFAFLNAFFVGCV